MSVRLPAHDLVNEPKGVQATGGSAEVPVVLEDHQERVRKARQQIANRIASQSEPDPQLVALLDVIDLRLDAIAEAVDLRTNVEDDPVAE
jgi:hypothetical protein